MRAITMLTSFLFCLATPLSAQLYAPFRFEHNDRTVDLLTIMQETHTPYLSVALDYGAGDTTFTASTTEQELSDDALFPVGAASSAPMIVLILQLVEAGKIKLDAPINDYLTSLELPLNQGQEVTVRDLLLMKPKLGSGYKPRGFAAGKPRPTLLEQARQLSPKGTRKPDKSLEHGGWILLQLLLEDYYGEDLQTIADREIFTPLCLESMIYASELPDELASRAPAGHDKDGSPWPGGYQRYVATGSHGLWTTPLDYTRFVRALFDIRDGKTNSILQPATLQMAMKRAYGFRSLLFHVGQDGEPYWGGNAKGYYFTLMVNAKENWISVVAMNRQLNWQLGGPVAGQAGLLAKQWRSTDQLGLFLQPTDLDDPTLKAIEHYAFYKGIRTERIMAKQGFPAEITATPAYVYQSPAGRAIYSGRHDSPKAIEQFIRSSQLEPRKMVADEQQQVLVLQRGRQRVSLPLKWTAPTGTTPADALPEQLQRQISAALQQATGFRQMQEASLTALDRRIYLDLHPYRNADGSYAMSYALFSQFNCHTQVADNFGNPVLIGDMGKGVEALATAINGNLEKMLPPESGLVPGFVSTDTPLSSWEALGWNLSPEVSASQATGLYAAPMAISGNYRVSLTEEDKPGLFFSFPSPLDRYSGEVRELTANFLFNATGTSLSGEVVLPTASIATGSGSLDTYVLGDILKSKKYPEASLSFTNVPVTGNWVAGQAKQLTIPAELTVRGKTYPISIAAAFTPEASGKMDASATFELDFRSVFGSPGPDGPDDIRRRLGFRAALSLAPAAK
ncbi:serine hydrolase [Neolewinella agarilytica]|uniref:CubicO group peptidase, beta-lactamase class C family n=1 Tax=Neolewinella agarilytica TaxID=478744 RepID=A0A1H9KQF7_9BACT|nr:serine hydrolase [Neolewinella agarilytica]SER01145.1 CubicO group peptidase, beta-lactamase class C family [Neolewinella agarilytica]